MHTRSVLPFASAAFVLALIGIGVGSTSSGEQPSTTPAPAPVPSLPVSAPAAKPAAAPAVKPGETGTAVPKLSQAKALEALKPDEGSWDAAMSFWFRPGTDPVRIHATVTARMALGSMYLEQRFEGAFGPEMGNKAFTTVSYTGFNAATGEYEAVRMASTHSTMICVRGKPSPDEGKGPAMELSGEYMFAGGKATQRDVIRHEGPDKCVIESWMSFAGTPEFKGAEMILTRAK